MQITSATKVAGLIGHPITHSLSPVLHNHLYQSLDLDIVYHAFDTAPNQVEAAINGFQALGFIGFNVTVPYKETVFHLLNCIDVEAQAIGAVNTVKIKNGVLKGYNTDGQGFIQHLKNSGFSLYGKKIVLLGAGGSARAIGIYMAKEQPAAIQIVNRTFEKASTLAGIINDYKGIRLAEALGNIPPDADFIINTTTLGMWPDKIGNPLQNYKLTDSTVVCDIVYNPRYTTMLQYAKEQGCKTCDGIGMLIGQGLKAAEIWLDYPLPSHSWQIMSKAVEMFK